MNWTSNDVRNREFTPHELDSLGTKFRGFSLFISVACREYKALSTNEQMDIIQYVYGVRRYTTEVKVGNMAHFVWKEKMHSSIRAAWKERAEVLNCRYVPGQFRTLSAAVPSDRDDFLRECYREETKYLQKCFKNAVTRQGLKNLAKRNMRIPHKLIIGTLAFV